MRAINFAQVNDTLEVFLAASPIGGGTILAGVWIAAVIIDGLKGELGPNAPW